MKKHIAGLTVHGGGKLPSNSYYREAVVNLEEAMIREFGKCDPDAVAPVNHYHCEGNYAREIFIPKDTCVIGKIHKHEHINVISKGKCLVVTEEGKEELEAPLTFISKAGIKRAVYALEDVVWTTIHPTESTNLKEIEDEVIAPSYGDLDNRLGEDL
jgi:hypothetical protein